MPSVENPSSKLLGIFDPQGSYVILNSDHSLTAQKVDGYHCEREVAWALCGLKKGIQPLFRCQYNNMKENSRQANLLTEDRHR